ncbi:hypothetical protein MHH28_14870 [Paenibacillus sp. FSL K6-1217]|uniref:hypothetical protein n=1 Tax=Paenibacillus sp. FSL K6-1217 TaxID=2921466 RepID=UPI0032452999
MQMDWRSKNKMPAASPLWSVFRPHSASHASASPDDHFQKGDEQAYERLGNAPYSNHPLITATLLLKDKKKGTKRSRGGKRK